MAKSLTLRQSRFITAYLSGQNATQAAITAGFAPKGAHTRGRELLNENDIVKAAIADEQAKLRRDMNYGTEKAMEELDKAIALAVSSKNATAYARCVELKSKLMGLMSEKKEAPTAALQINITGVDMPGPAVAVVAQS